MDGLPNYNLPFILLLFKFWTILYLQSIIQSKDVVMDVVLSRTSAYQLKELTKVQRISSINLDTTRHKNNQSIGIIRWLHIHTLDTVLDLSDRV
mmetsp:Transcript_76863/g.222131  ORF Transcript_76863/g.222131 Transcript_76863/m.222131 type:complete len:94 (+) Transcript_76863:196-477(+)